MQRRKRPQLRKKRMRKRGFEVGSRYVSFDDFGTDTDFEGIRSAFAVESFLILILIIIITETVTALYQGRSAISDLPLYYQFSVTSIFVRPD